MQIMSRSLHRVESKFDQLADVLQMLVETSRTSRPSSSALTTPVTFSRPTEHITIAEHSASSHSRPAEHNNHGQTANCFRPVSPTSAIPSAIPHAYHSTTNEPLPGQLLQNVLLNTNAVTIELGEMQLTFDPATVPDPPTVTFADDIELLVEEWRCSERLVVAGKGIPICCWDKVYSKRAGVKEHAWSSLRCSWGNWKVSQLFISVHCNVGLTWFNQ